MDHTTLETRAHLPPHVLLADAGGDVLDVVVGFDRLMAVLSALRAQALDQARQWFERSEWARPTSADGSWSAATTAQRVAISEVAAALRIPESTAGRLLAQSESLVHDLPATLTALGAGDISYRHAEVVVDNAQSLPPEARADFEAAVLPRATRLTAARFRESARRTRETVHPESIAERRRTQADRRSVGVEPARDGMAWLTAFLPAEQALAIDDRLDRIAAALRSPDEPRTFAQLRADAFCDLLTCGEVAGTGAGTGHDGATARIGHGIQAQVLVTVPVLTLLGRTDDGGVLEPGSLEGYGPIPGEIARLLAAEATSFTRLLTHPETGSVVSVGRDSYQVPADLRRWVRLRDETCRAVGCGRRSAGCDLDHVVDWQFGGSTAGDNLITLCRRHHQTKHHTGWSPRLMPGSTVEWTSPSGRTYATEPSTVLRT